MRHLSPALFVLCAAAVLGGCSEATLSGARPADGPRAVAAPSPAQMEASAARHPACDLVPLATDAGAPVRLPGDTDVSLRLPGDFTAAPLSGNPARVRSWTGPDGTSLTVAASPGGQFMMGLEGTAERRDEGHCSQRFAGRLARVSRARLVSEDGRDTLYAATVDVAQRADRWIGAGVVSRSAAGRERALAAFATLRVDD